MQYQYAVIEQRRAVDNTLAHNAFWFSDVDDETARRQAESKYYDLLSNAAVSSAAQWAVSLIAPQGYCRMYHCYYINTDPDI